MVLATCGRVAAPRECWLPCGVSAFCRGQRGAHGVGWGLDSGKGETVGGQPVCVLLSVLVCPLVSGVDRFLPVTGL